LRIRVSTCEFQQLTLARADWRDMARGAASQSAPPANAGVPAAHVAPIAWRHASQAPMSSVANGSKTLTAAPQKRNRKVFFLYFAVTSIAGLRAPCGAHFCFIARVLPMEATIRKEVRNEKTYRRLSSIA